MFYAEYSFNWILLSIVFLGMRLVYIVYMLVLKYYSRKHTVQWTGRGDIVWFAVKVDIGSSC